MSAKKKEEPEKENEEVAATEEGGEGEGGKKKGKKKLLFIIIGVVVVVLIVVGVMLSGVLGGGGEEGAEPAAKHDAAKSEDGHGKSSGHGEATAGPVYYELPQFLVNLNSTTGRVSFLKMGVTLELRDAEAVAMLDANKPRVVDTFNTFLRELRPADIQGSAGIYRLRDELMKRLNGTIEEGVVKDILFSEIIVQ
jgi:flagellar FliL protein